MYFWQTSMSNFIPTLQFYKALCDCTPDQACTAYAFSTFAVMCLPFGCPEAPQGTLWKVKASSRLFHISISPRLRTSRLILTLARTSSLAFKPRITCLASMQGFEAWNVMDHMIESAHVFIRDAVISICM